jgi:hypothetical protein
LNDLHLSNRHIINQLVDRVNSRCSLSLLGLRDNRLWSLGGGGSGCI